MLNSSRQRFEPWHSDIQCSELVEVLTKSRIDVRPSMVAIVVAISEIEAVLSCEAPLRRGGPIHVNAASWSFRARVTGCRKDPGLAGYSVLAKFEEPFRWSAEAFRPESMLDLKTLAGQDSASQTTPARVITAGQSF